VPTDIASAIPIQDGLLQGAEAGHTPRTRFVWFGHQQALRASRYFPFTIPFGSSIDVRGVVVREKEKEKVREKERSLRKKKNRRRRSKKEADKDKERKEVAKVEPRNRRGGWPRPKNRTKTFPLSRQLGPM